MLKFMLANPAVSHAALAVGYTAVLAVVLGLYGPIPPYVVAAFIVSAFFYGREAGQHEHDLKNRGADPITAWLGAEFLYAWTGANVIQWLAPATASAAVAGAIVAAGHYWATWSFIAFPG